MKRAILLTVFAMSLALGSGRACLGACIGTPSTPQMVQQSVPVSFNISWWLIFFHF